MRPQGKFAEEPIGKPIEAIHPEPRKEKKKVRLAPMCLLPQTWVLEG